jgi:hypothetical protein
MNASSDFNTMDLGYNMTFDNEGEQFAPEEPDAPTAATSSKQKFYFEEEPMQSVKNVQPGRDGKFRCLRSPSKCKEKYTTRRDLQ